MAKPQKPVFYMLFFSGLLILAILIMQPLQIYHFKEYIAVLFPKGTIAFQQRNLLFVIQALMLLVIIPVYVLTFIFSWWFRADNKKALYDPDLVDNKIAEVIWWGLPLVMTAIVCVLATIKTYELDPFKPIVSKNKEMKIQVVALQWKWLFIYPEEGIASVNFFQIPRDTPIHFEITADAPMNSFWIPDLGGQIYAMPNMRTELYLIANDAGEFPGVSANLSGEGFAGMRFIAKAGSVEDYKSWVAKAKGSNALSFEEYEKLAKPSSYMAPITYRLADSNLFEQVLMKFMPPKSG